MCISWARNISLVVPCYSCHLPPWVFGGICWVQCCGLSVLKRHLCVYIMLSIGKYQRRLNVLECWCYWMCQGGFEGAVIILTMVGTDFPMSLQKIITLGRETKGEELQAGNPNPINGTWRFMPHFYAMRPCLSHWWSQFPHLQSEHSSPSDLQGYWKL